MKRIFYILLIVLFSGMSFAINYKNSFYYVLEVISPNKIVIDLNHNNIQEDNEIFDLQDIKVRINPDDKLSEKEIFIFNQLAKQFSSETLYNKKVQTKRHDILINKKNYVQVFNESGFNYETAPEKYSEIINNIKSRTFYAINPYNSKIHTLNCPFAEKGEHFSLISEPPTNTIPCKACFTDTKQPLQKDFISPNIKLTLSDHTINLKPDNNCSSNICKELLYQIKNAKESIDFAIYGYNTIPEIEMAIKSALARGIKIRMIYDVNSKNETDYSDSKRLATIIKHVQNDLSTEGLSKYSNSLMHNKFFIFDNKTVLTGSANLSQNDMSGFNSNATIRITSPQIAEIYLKEFEQMYTGKFHNLKDKTQNNTKIQLDGSEISVFFSPQDRITKNQILPLIQHAKSYIYIPAFLITDKWLADELINCHNRKVDIKIILDASSSHSQYSQIKYLRDNGIKVKVENYAGKIHSKSIIIDDSITIIGSMNFSKSGQNNNDENVIIIKNSALAKTYREHFEYLWNRIDAKWLKFTPRAEGLDSIGSCHDKIDNNYDGQIDSADIGCK